MIRTLLFVLVSTLIISAWFHYLATPYLATVLLLLIVGSTAYHHTRYRNPNRRK